MLYRNSAKRGLAKRIKTYLHGQTTSRHRKLYLSVITVLELETGILLIERRDKAQGALLRTWLNTHVLPAFSERIIVIDTSYCTGMCQITCTRSSFGQRRYDCGDGNGSRHGGRNQKYCRFQAYWR